MSLDIIIGKRFKPVEIKFYIVILSAGEYVRLWTGPCYSLEEAISNGMIDAEADVAGTEGEWKMMMYRIVSISQLTSMLVKMTDVTMSKKELMSRIINNLDREMFDKNRDRFTESEIRLIENRIRFKKRKKA